MNSDTTKPSKPSDSETQLSSSHSRGTILVVEDDQDSRELLCLILESLGFETLCFGNGEGVVESIKGRCICLAMLDIMMPKVDGYELLAALRESPEFCNLPVFMVTAKSEDNEVLEGYKHGADYYIMKPFSSKQIEYGIKLFLENNEEESPRK